MEIIEEVQEIEEVEILVDKWDLICEEIYNGTLSMSFSKLHNFRRSPLHFKNYVCRAVEQTPAMKFGIAMHTLILEGEEEFLNRFLPLDRPTDLRLKKPKEGFITQLEYRDYQVRAASQNKEIVTKSDYDKSKRIRSMFMMDFECRNLLLGLANCEFDIEYEYEGYKFRGRGDGEGIGYDLDLKNMNGKGDLSESRVGRTVLDSDYDIQAVIYLGRKNPDNIMKAIKETEYWILATDGQGVVPIRLKKQTLVQAYDKLNYTLREFQRCKDKYLFEQSYSFWNRKKFIEI